MKTCPHRNFDHDLQIAIVEDIAKYVVELRIKCADCGELFRFAGLPAGLDYTRPMVSIDSRELRAPIEPVGDRVIMPRGARYMRLHPTTGRDEPV